MSWQAASFALLALALAGGFAWYERSKPDARIVALVATLAAFAALGRIAFAALPNVKPTTDIVLISGYALGGAPGFVVGALAGLVSNFFFGQGPWTPWQMAAWGATGVLGATLGGVTRHRIGRWPLAIACALTGYAFAAFQDFGDWVTYSDHSLAQLGVYVGKGTGFDFIHAGGCLAFALAFGPALTKALNRFTARIQIVWRPAGSTTTILALLAVLAIGAAAVGPPPARAASPSSYLLSAQNSDGGFGAAPGQPSSTLYAGWAALGLAAAGSNPQDVRRGGPSLLDYIASSANQLSDPGSIERTILAVRAAGASPSSFAGANLTAELERRIAANGSVSDQVNWTSFAILALRAAGLAPPAKTVAWLLRQQNADGGFSFATAGGGSDVDDTGAVLEALAGIGGPASRTRAKAVAFVRGQQNRDGGFPSTLGGYSNAQSTAWAIQGLVAAGVGPAAVRRPGGASPLQYLESLTAPDGHVRYAAGSDQTPVWVTAEAMMALAEKPLPLAPAPRAPAPAASSAPAQARSATAANGKRGAGRTHAAGGNRRARNHTNVRHKGLRPTTKPATPSGSPLMRLLPADVAALEVFALAATGSA